MPIKQAGYTQVKANQKRDRKRRQAYDRQDAHDALSTSEKLAKIEWRRKNGMGESRKEHVRLLLLDEPVVPVKVVAKSGVEVVPGVPATPPVTKKRKSKTA
jgi:hypothetical protein